MTATVETVAGPMALGDPTLVPNPTVGDLVVYAGSLLEFCGVTFEVVDPDEEIPDCSCPNWRGGVGACPHLPWRAYRLRSPALAGRDLICRWHSVRRLPADDEVSAAGEPAVRRRPAGGDGPDVGVADVDGPRPAVGDDVGGGPADHHVEQ